MFLRFITERHQHLLFLIDLIYSADLDSATWWAIIVWGGFLLFDIIRRLFRILKSRAS